MQAARINLNVNASKCLLAKMFYLPKGAFSHHVQHVVVVHLVQSDHLLSTMNSPVILLHNSEWMRGNTRTSQDKLFQYNATIVIRHHPAAITGQKAGLVRLGVDR